VPKLSVYIPDELWEQVRGSAPDGNASQLVQRALKTLVVREPRAAYSQEPPSPAAASARAVTERLIEEAREEWAKGYTAAIEWSIKHGTWHRLQLFAREGFNLEKWIAFISSIWLDHETQMKGPDEMREEQVALANALGSKADPWGIIEWDSSATFCEGFAKALSDLWRSVENGEPIFVPASGGNLDGKKEV
jgi:hypothetical protein